MDLNLVTALSQVKMAMMDAAEKSTKRRLAVHSSTIACKKGCDGCCSRMVYVTIAEAVILQEHVQKEGKWPEVRARAISTATVAKVANPVSWFKMNFKCPVLDPETKSCLAYKVRPAPCSVHFVTSDPALCDPWSTSGGDYLPLDMDDVYEEASKRIESKIDGHGILAFRLPLPIALLFAERIKHRRGLTSQEVMSFIFNELK
jgi:Fe-S-cluster containining protein